ncbi:MAG: nickel pincer cofactor biosynthesis protein LarC [Firmicutes bacterium]|nr:nickel pincer cofactor biosynthesis protein LarC [Bacillota bacterium]
MKIAYLDPVGGIAGDMFLAALLDLYDNKEEEQNLLDLLKRLPLDHWHWETKSVIRGGFRGTKIDFHAETEKDHRHLRDIVDIITKANFPKNAEEKILKTFDLLAEAEAKVHGMEKNQVHFHEVGAVDTILDICSVCLLLTEHNIEKLICAPLPMGKGTVKCAHGIIPLPGPAVGELLKGAAVKESNIIGETITPTGIALLKAFDATFSDFPAMTVDATGCGCGTRDHETPNILRIFSGSIKDQQKPIYRLECTIDDMTGEELGYAWDHIIKAGANDMYYTPVYMKKGRPAVKLTVLAKEDHLEQIKQTIFTHTSTLGMICEAVDRFVLPRRFESAETPWGTVRYKIAEDDQICKCKPEFEDLKTIADKEGISLKEARLRADRFFMNQNKEK